MPGSGRARSAGTVHVLTASCRALDQRPVPAPVAGQKRGSDRQKRPLGRERPAPCPGASCRAGARVRTHALCTNV
eukprot:14736243-Heterocapsa_arctica.AAC.1